MATQSTLEKQTEAFAKAVADGKPFVTLTGALLHDLASRLALSDSNETAKAIKQTLPVAGKGKRKLTVEADTAKFLAKGIQQPAPPTAPPKKK